MRKIEMQKLSSEQDVSLWAPHVTLRYVPDTELYSLITISVITWNKHPLPVSNMIGL